MKNKCLKVCSAVVLIVLVSVVSSAQAGVNGIGAAIWHETDVSLRMYKISNTHVDTMYDLYKGPEVFGYPVINTHGTHVAFWRVTGPETAPEYRLTVMRVNDPDKKIDLVLTGLEIPAENDDYEVAVGSIAWPQGDWIYFSSHDRYRYMYRVNTQTRAIEFVTPIDNSKMVYGDGSNSNTALEWKMSSVGLKVLINQTGLVFSLEEMLSAKGVPGYSSWADGGMQALGGCGQTISPSGNLGGCQYDAGHVMYIIDSLDWRTHSVTNIGAYTAEARNEWSVDKSDPELACSIAQEGFIESVGFGNETYGHNFAVNSDKWVGLLSGWAPSGRFGENGMNFILVNFRDQVSLNVSRGPRSGTVEPQCYKQNTRTRANATAFFVSSPVEDILPELRADAGENYMVPGLDDNTQFPALSMMPKTPDGGYPVASVHGPSGIAHGAEFKPVIARCMTDDGPGISVDFCGWSGRYRIIVFDSRGTMVAERTGQNQREAFSSQNGFQPGFYILRIMAAGAGVITLPAAFF